VGDVALIRFAWGGLRLSLLEAGHLWLDGGAMFGVVPKPLWSRLQAPDERNRIRLGMNLLLIEDGEHRTLVDTGAGTDWNDKLKDIYGLETRTPEEILSPAGLEPGQIDRVINSHLHFDHAGGNTVPDGQGGYLPAFPNAEYVVQKGELETARLQNERIRASYREAGFEPLAEQGRLRLVEGDVELSPHVQLRVARGHTPAMQIVLVVTDEGTVAYLADLVPTSSHVHYPFIMSYDLEPLETLATKKRLLPLAAAEGWRVVFEHDAGMPLATLTDRNGRLEARPVDLGS
jgi:glyoxylase-like metal-dependent hydrolase (beta-lactamase superfamily II)